MSEQVIAKRIVGSCVLVLSVCILGFTAVAAYRILSDVMDGRGVMSKDPVLIVSLLALGLVVLVGAVRMVRRPRQGGRPTQPE